MMFVSVVLAAAITLNADARDAELGRRVLWYLFVGVCNVVLFVAFFVGLKVFIGGILREVAGSRTGPGPDERGGESNQSLSR
jgi:hypothetical protein